MKKIVRWCVSDRDGNVVIGQPANLPIMVGVLAALLTVVIPGVGRLVVGLIAFGALFTWAWLEIFDGTTPLRRVTGGLFIVALVTLSVLLLGAKGF